MSTILQEQEWSVSVVSRMVFVGMCIDERACDEGHATISKSIRCLEEIVDELMLDDMISSRRSSTISRVASLALHAVGRTSFPA